MKVEPLSWDVMDQLPVLSLQEIVLRVGVAALLGGLVGFEREFSDQPAGFRTHILVALGAMLFTMVGAYGINEFLASDADLNFDPTRIAAQVVTGIGFLGAGAILREGFNVKGLTTAAALWVTAAVGVSVGLGYWEAAVTTTLGAVLALYGLKRIERVVFPRLKRGHFRFTIQMGMATNLAEVAAKVENHGGRVHSMKIVTGEGGERHVVGDLRLPPDQDPDQVAEAICHVEGVTGVDWRN